MVGGVGNFNGMVDFFLGMVGTARFSSSISSSSPSVFSLVLPLMLILVPCLLVRIPRRVLSFHNSNMPLLFCRFLSHGLVPCCIGGYYCRIFSGVLGRCFWCFWVWAG